MATTIEGKIDKVYRNKVNTKYGEKMTTRFLIDGKYYSGGFKKWSIGEGDTVELTFETNAKGYHDIKSVAVIDKAPENMDSASPADLPPTVAKARNSGGGWSERKFPVDPLAPERTINRQNALTNAVAYCGNAKAPVDSDTIIEVARMFEAYTTGDMDREEAMAILEAEKGE